MLIAGAFFVTYNYLPTVSEPEPEAIQEITGDIVQVRMEGLKYDKTDITIKQGDTVQFINGGDDIYWPASNIHPTHGIYPEFDPRHPVQKGESWSFVFDKKGSWRFHDHLHPTITGVIKVQ